MRSIYSKKQRFIMSKLIWLIVIGLWVMASVSLGQQSSTSENKSDQNLKSSARINPSTLAMEFSLPLGVYPGRNGNSLPLNFTYSSKVWESKIGGTSYQDRRATTGGIFNYTVASFNYSHKSLAGWSHSLAPPRIIESASTFIEHPTTSFSFLLEIGSDDATIQQINSITENLNGDTTSNIDQCEDFTSADGYTCSICTRHDGHHATVYDVWCRYGGVGDSDPRTTRGTVGAPPPAPSPNNRIVVLVKRKKVQMPDGSVVEFRLDDKTCQFGFSGSTPCLAATGAYLSVDGSRMRLERVEVQSGVFRDVLYLPDGSRYIFSTVGGVTGGNEFIDRDGNKTTYDAAQKIWTDTMGRQIINPFPNLVSIPSNPNQSQTGNYSNPQAETTNTISLPSLPNTSRQAQFVWKKLKSEGCETDTTGTCGESVLENPAQELRNIGSENCATPWTDNANQSSLFQGRQYEITNSFTTYYKENVCGTPGRFNPVVLKEVVMPDGKKYEFRYNLYGEISRIKYPTGAVERFTYGFIEPVGYDMKEAFKKSNRGVVQRKVYLNEQNANTDTPEQVWNYAVELIPNTVNPNYVPLYKVKITAPDQSYSERFIYRSAGGSYGFSSMLDGMTYEEKTYSAPNSNNVQKLVTRTLSEWTEDGPLAGGYASARRNPRPLRTISIMFEVDKALATMSENEYEVPGENAGDPPTDPSYFAKLNVKSTKSYHYLPLDFDDAQTDSRETIKNQFILSGQVASLSKTEYLYDANYKARGITSLPVRTKVLNPSDPNEVIAKTETFFDEYSPESSGTLSGNLANTWIDPTTDFSIPVNSRNLRGKPTTSKVWDSDNSAWIETHSKYDEYGNGRKMWEVNKPVSSDRFIETQYDSQYGFAYPTTVITPAPDPSGINGTNQGSTTSTTYDLTTGLPLTVADDYGQVTTTEYDNLLRPKKVILPTGGAITETEYGVPDANGTLPPAQRFIKVKKQIDSNKWDESINWFDELGRTIKTQTKDSQGDVFTETEYDFMGRIKRVTKPFRDGQTKLWTSTEYDELGRPKRIITPDLTTTLTEYGISTAPYFTGIYITNTDSSERKQRSISNALGQLIRVDEPISTGGNVLSDLGSLESPQQATNYKYNPQGQMVEVTQGAQKRFFKYDSLGRLIRVRQPEQTPNQTIQLADSITGNAQWTSAFTYDNKGNILTSKDAKGNMITYSYDQGNRIITRSYSDGTPAVNYKYDGLLTEFSNITNPTMNYSKGNLTEISSSVSTRQYTSFDNLGRVKTHRQITDGNTYDTSYVYNLSGMTVEQTYPSGRVVKNSLDSTGDLAQVESRRNSNAIYRTYASNISHTASGGISSMRLGNGRWETTKFNSRGQITETGLGYSATNADLWKVNYEYGELNASNNVDATKNAGNIGKLTISIAGQSHPFIQIYRYDPLDRLVEAKETANGQENWQQTWGYDRYGNRTTFSQTTGGNQLQLNNLTHPQIDPATNRFVAGQGYTYDFNGNLIQDAENRGFTFNGDNKQTEVRDLNIQTSPQNPDANLVGRYLYDGEGRRVKKLTRTETTIFVYDAVGRMVGEYSTKLAQTPTVSYLTTDHLNSPRIISDTTGNVVSRRDFMPFGEELFAGVGGRGESLKYSAAGTDGIRKRFTGYEKDEETGLDYAEARYYNNQHGRFTAVDPLLSSGKSSNPQTFNRYVYVGNNPLSRTDPNGLEWYQENHTECSSTTTKCIDGVKPAWRPSGVAWLGYTPWQGGYIFRIGGVKDRGRYNVLNPFEPQADIRSTQAGAEALLAQYKRQAAIDFIVGAISEASIAGSLATMLVNTGANENSEMYKEGRKEAFLVQMAAAIATGGGGIGAKVTDRAFTMIANRFGSKAARAILPVLQKLCFTAGTKIHTDKGLKSIEQIKKGDKVLSYNEQTKKFEYKTVVQTFVNQTPEIVKVKIKGERKLIEATPEHPFYVKTFHQARDNTASEDDDEGEWLSARKLQAGDLIKTANGTWRQVVSIELETRHEAVYNFEVEDNHNYFVGEIGFLVHNDGCGQTIALGLREGLDSFASKFGAKTWKELAPDALRWKDWFMEAMSNTNNKVVFNLDGVDNVWSAVQRGASGTGGATDWELFMIKQNEQWWSRVQFVQNGQAVANPFQ